MPNPPDEVGALPQFPPVNPDDPLAPGAILSHPDEPSPPASEAQSRTSIPLDPPLSQPPRRETPPKTSSTTSSEVLDEGLADVAGGLFYLGGALANKTARRRTRSDTRAWIPTEDEVTSFSEAAGRIAARRVPEAIAGGDGPDLLTMGGVALSYGIRNALGISDAELAAAGNPGAAPVSTPAQAPPPGYAPPPYVEPPSAPPPRQAPAPATVGVLTPDVHGVVAAEPPPPDVISPNI